MADFWKPTLAWDILSSKTIDILVQERHALYYFFFKYNFCTPLKEEEEEEGDLDFFSSFDLVVR